MCRSLIVAILLGIITQDSVSTSCSGVDKGSATCLQQIQQTFGRQDFFWWGTWYNDNCPNGNKLLYCNKRPQLSGGTLTSALNGLDGSEIDRYLNVEYTSRAGKYQGCDTTITREADRTFSLDPLSMELYPSWDARLRPTVSWNTTSDDKYTLIVLDVGVGIVHAVWANIAGGSLPGDGTDLSNIDIVKAYNGPKSPFYEWPNAYAFFLFKQESANDITIDSSNFSIPFSPQSSLSTFKTTYSLAGPIAANWLLTEGDIYATNFMKSINAISNCPSFVERALMKSPHNGRPFIPADPQLSVFIHVEMIAPEMKFSICCQDKTAPATKYVLDPIGNPTLTGAGTRSDGTTQKFTFEKAAILSIPNAGTLTGEVHTMIAVDPDVPNPAAGNNSHPILHMLVTNIQDGIFKSGDAVQPYRGPRPPDGPHVYYFLLYKQMDPTPFMFNFTDVRTEYILSPTCERCLFDINQFVTDKNLELVGATWMTVPPDSYVEYSYVQSGRDESTYCSDVEGWTPNQTCSASNVLFKSSVLLLGLIFLNMFTA